MTVARVRGLYGEVLDGLLAEFEALVMRILRRIAQSAASLLAGHSHASVDDLAVIPKQWVEAVDGEVMPALSGVYGRAAAAVVDGLAAFGHDVAALRSPDGADFMAEARNRLVGIGDAVWEAARDELVAGMHAGEGIDQLAARVARAADVSEARATVIARTECVAANNAASFAQALMLDDPGMTKSWEATPDGRTRSTHRVADGQSVPLRQPFEVGGAALLYPGDPTGPVEEVAGCRCAQAYDLADPLVASFDEGKIKRDGAGRFAEKAGGGGFSAWLHDTVPLDVGTMVVGAADDGRVTLNLGDGAVHTSLTESTADDFAHELQSAADPEATLDVGRERNFADYPPDDDHAYALSYASIKRTGEDTFEINLSNGDGSKPREGSTFTVNGAEAAALGADVQRLASARKVSTSAGDFAAILERGGQVTTKWPASAGAPITLSLSVDDADRVAAAIKDGIGAVDEWDPALGPDDVASRVAVDLPGAVLTVSAFGRYGEPSGRFELESSAHDWVLRLPDVEAEYVGDALQGPVLGSRDLVTASAGSDDPTVASAGESSASVDGGDECGDDFCRNPLHPGPCAKPGDKAYKRRHKGGDGPPAGDGEEPEHETPKAAPSPAARKESPKKAPKAEAPKRVSEPAPAGPSKYSGPRYAQPADVDAKAAAVLRKRFHVANPDVWSQGHVSRNLAYPSDDETEQLINQVGPTVATRLAWEADNEAALARLVQLHRPDDPNVGPYDDLPAVTDTELAQIKKAAGEQLRKDFAGKPVSVRLTGESLDRVLDDGRFKTQFETKKSGGGYLPTKRAAAEKMMFGLGEDTDPKARPVYGYLPVDKGPNGGGSDLLDTYGDVQVVLKDSVRSRTTASVGDSLDRQVLPSPVDDPSWESFNASAHWSDGVAMDYGSQRGILYLEAQVHGGVGVADIESVAFAVAPSAATKKRLSDLGIPWRMR